MVQLLEAADRAALLEVRAAEAAAEEAAEAAAEAAEAAAREAAAMLLQASVRRVQAAAAREAAATLLQRCWGAQAAARMRRVAPAVSSAEQLISSWCFKKGIGAASDAPPSTPPAPAVPAAGSAEIAEARQARPPIGARPQHGSSPATAARAFRTAFLVGAVRGVT